MTDKLGVLYDITGREGIQMEEWDFPSSLLGLYMKEPGCPPTIGLNKDIVYNTKLHTCVLAEEIGHYYTTSGDCVSPFYSFNERVVYSKKERLAMKWAVDFLIPINEIITAVREGLTIEDVSDRLSVSRKFLDYGLMLYSKIYPYIKIKDGEFLILQGYPNVYIYREL